MKRTDGVSMRIGDDRDPWVDRLSEYLDGDLPPAERRLLEAHLADCSECTAVLDELRLLVAQAPDLAVPLEPEDDLWPDIGGRLRPRSGASWIRRWTFPEFVQWRLPLAAAAALALIGVALVLWLSRGQPGIQPEPEIATRATSVVPREQSERQYADRLAELRRIVHTRLTRDPRVVDVIEDNLAVLDVAIAQYQDALVQQPGDTELGRRLAAAKQRKLTVLERAAALANDAAN